MKKTGFARRAFAWMLCLAMVLSMLPGAVFAQEIPEETTLPEGTVEIATEETLPVEETTEGSTEEPEEKSQEVTPLSEEETYYVRVSSNLPLGGDKTSASEPCLYVYKNKKKQPQVHLYGADAVVTEIEEGYQHQISIPNMDTLAVADVTIKVNGVTIGDEATGKIVRETSYKPDVSTIPGVESASTFAVKWYPSNISNGELMVNMKNLVVSSDISIEFIFGASTAVSVESVTLNQTAATLKEGETLELEATVTPEDATDKTVTWESSDPKVATVSGGTVKAVSEGTATITAKAGDKTATCAVTVEPLVVGTITVTSDSPIPEITEEGYPESQGYLYGYGDQGATLRFTLNNPSDKGTWSNGRWLKRITTSDLFAATTDATENEDHSCTIDTTDLEIMDNADYQGVWYRYCADYSIDGRTYNVVSNEIYAYVKITDVSQVPVPVFTTDLGDGASFTLDDNVPGLRVVTKVSAGKVTYQWYWGTEDGYEKGVALAGHTSSSDTALPFTGKNALGDRYYYVVATNTIQGYTVTACSNIYKATVQELDSGEFAFDLDGTGTEDAPYLIEDAGDYQKIRYAVAEGQPFQGQYFRQTADITLPEDWEPIGHSISRRFQGTIDGDGHLLTVPEGGKPLLGYVQNVTVKNLNLYGKRIEGYGLIDNYVGISVVSVTTLENITIKSGTNILKSGLLGSYITTNQWAGASASYTTVIRNCTAETGVTIGYDGTQSNIGSFAGRFNGTMENCVSYATVKGVDYVGGLVGCMDNAMGTCAISGSAFHGSVTASGEFAGGILGGGYDDYDLASAPNGLRPKLKNNTADGTVTGISAVGGIWGGDQYVAQSWNSNECSGNTFTGTLSGNQYVGGVIGYLKSLNKWDNIVSNSYSGADQGIGYVLYLDTSYEKPTTLEGMTVVNTGNSVEDCPTVLWMGTWKKDHNRTDDPLGADAEKLCKKLSQEKPAEPVVYALEVSGTYKTTYTVGEALDLTGIQLTAKWTEGKADTTVSLSDVTISGYDKTKTGTQTVILTYNNVKAEITVTVVPKSNKITVSVSILGDSSHGEGAGPHGLALGGLTTWASNTKMEAETSETVWDVLSRLAASSGVTIGASYSAKYNSYYIESVNGLGEFDNGPNSGWMYTVNGTHPEVGVSARYVKSGDKIVLHYTDDYNYEEGGIYYGQQKKDAAYVDGLIAAIGTVTYTDGCKQKIDAARAAYNALSDTEKAKVTGLATLEAAEKAYQELKEKDDAAKAQTVIDLIGKIGTVTAESGKAITAARTAYNALTADQKALVTNYTVLTRAETAYAKLVATDADKEAAQAVMDLIAAAQTQEEIDAARAAYEALTDLQKQLVENYALLESLEAQAGDSLSKIAHAYLTTGEYIFNLGAPSVGSIGGEWMVIGLARSGLEVPGREEYIQGVENYLRENMDENQRLHKAKSTNNSRIILALTALGMDARDVAGFDLIQGLSSMDFVKKQGNNGPIWALIALDSGNYPVPEGNVTRQGLIDEILSVQTSDGGWAISGEEADSDMTGMALQALAPYYQENAAVQQAVDKAVDRLSRMQNEDGGFGTFSGNGKVATSESTAQVIVALAALGIDPDTDPRFVKAGGSAVDALLSYFVEGGGFRHIASGELDGMATEQGYYALTAYSRFLEGKTSLYNMTDVVDFGGDAVQTQEIAQLTTQAPEITQQSEKENNFPWVAMVLVLALGVGLGIGGTLAVVVIAPKLKKKPEAGR